MLPTPRTPKQATTTRPGRPRPPAHGSRRGMTPRASSPATGSDDEDQQQADADAAPVEVGEQARRRRRRRAEQHREGQQPLQARDDVVHRAVVVGAVLGAAQRHRAGEDGQEAVAVRQLGHAVRREERGQRQQRLALLGQAQHAGRLRKATAAEAAADDDADPHADGDLAQQVPGEELATPPTRDPPASTSTATCTNGKARPSLRPASEVSEKRTSPASVTTVGSWS